MPKKKPTLRVRGRQKRQKPRPRPTFLDRFDQLVERYREPGDSDYAACQRLLPALNRQARRRRKWGVSYPLHVYHRNPRIQASPELKSAVIALLKAKPRLRNDRPRLYIPFEKQSDIDYVSKHLSAEDRRDVLMAAASHEDFGDE